MAKRKKKEKKSANSGEKLVNFLGDERVKISLGLFTLSFSIVLLLAFISYLFTWKVDQSFQWQPVVSGSEVSVSNWSGKVGAFFANLFLYKWFGLASFSVPFALIVLGFRFFKIRLFPLRKTLLISLIATFLTSVTLSYLFTNVMFLGAGPGGKHGFAVNAWLEAFLGKTGEGFLILLFIAVFIIFSIQDAVPKILAFFKGEEFVRETFDTEKQVSVDNDLSFEAEKIKAETKVDFDIQKNFSENGDSENIEQTNIKKPEKEEVDDSLKIEVISKTEEPVAEKIEIKKEEDQNTDSDVDFKVAESTKEEVSKEVEHKGIDEDYDPTLDLASYVMPSIELLEDYKSPDAKVTDEELLTNKNKIVETLGNYNIKIDKIMATIGPTVTLYEIVPAPGVKISKIKNLEDDIALSLAALGIRIIAPIPGKGTIGIEVPNLKTEIVSMRSILATKKFSESTMELPIALGKTISNETAVFDLAKMPHLLVAGATGQGKSVGLNAIITSLLYKKHPSQMKFVMVDPKKVELTLYSKIERHYLAKLPDEEEAIITDTQKVIHTLHSLTIEMDERYDLLKAAFVRNIKEYNAKFISRKLSPEKGHRFLPYIIVVIDEFADLIMTAGKEVEAPIARLAQLARAIGIHLIIATQRPTTNIITGVIKANFPARIAFRVTSMIDSRTILDSPGANQLIGRGDMLVTQGSDLIRLQCAFVDIPELERITEFIGNQRAYPSALLLPEVSTEETAGPDVDLSKRDDMFEEAARLVVNHQQGSTSLIQRKFSIGYNRAGRIIDQLEAAGIVGPFEGSKARQVLYADEYSLEQFLNELN